MLELGQKCTCWLLNLCIDKGRWWGARGSEETVLLFLAVSGVSGHGKSSQRRAVRRHLLQAGVTQASKIPESMGHNQSFNYENVWPAKRAFKLVVAVHAVPSLLSD